VASNGMIFTPSFVKIHHSIQKLLHTNLDINAEDNNKPSLSYDITL